MGYVITVINIFIIIIAVNSPRCLPGAEAAGLEAHEDGADEFAKGGGVDRV